MTGSKFLGTLAPSSSFSFSLLNFVSRCLWSRHLSCLPGCLSVCLSVLPWPLTVPKLIRWLRGYGCLVRDSSQRGSTLHPVCHLHYSCPFRSISQALASLGGLSAWLAGSVIYKPLQTLWWPLDNLHSTGLFHLFISFFIQFPCYGLVWILSITYAHTKWKSSCLSADGISEKSHSNYSDSALTVLWQGWHKIRSHWFFWEIVDREKKAACQLWTDNGWMIGERGLTGHNGCLTSRTESLLKANKSTLQPRGWPVRSELSECPALRRVGGISSPVIHL